MVLTVMVIVCMYNIIINDKLWIPAIGSAALSRQSPKDSVVEDPVTFTAEILKSYQILKWLCYIILLLSYIIIV